MIKHEIKKKVFKLNYLNGFTAERDDFKSSSGLRTHLKFISQSNAPKIFAEVGEYLNVFSSITSITGLTTAFLFWNAKLLF